MGQQPHVVRVMEVGGAASRSAFLSPAAPCSLKLVAVRRGTTEVHVGLPNGMVQVRDRASLR
jgi:hypothetical protein